MTHVDLDTWKRREHFNFFRRMDYPQFNVCFDLPVTDLVAFVKKNRLSFYYSMIYYATKTANLVSEFKYRIRGDKIVLHETLHPSFADMSRGDDLFKLVTVDMKDDLRDFIESAKKKSGEQTEYFPVRELQGRDDLVYITCLPWISFTHISHTISQNKDDAVPRISWGKYYEEAGKYFLPFSVQVNHVFADGFHIGKYKELLEEQIGSLLP
jgi:chloramphenicol O-acetyltransferase type A